MRRIVELHIEPLAPPERPERRAAERTKCDVLTIEDADDARQSLRMALEMDGHRVQSATDGASGLKALLETRPDIAFIDIGLPMLNGYEVARRARAAGVRARLVALRGYGLPEDKTQADNAGFDAHFTKPTPIDRVLALVAETSCTGQET